jgi:hypothetical protein
MLPRLRQGEVKPDALFCLETLPSPDVQTGVDQRAGAAQIGRLAVDWLSTYDIIKEHFLPPNGFYILQSSADRNHVCWSRKSNYHNESQHYKLEIGLVTQPDTARPGVSIEQFWRTKYMDNEFYRVTQKTWLWRDGTADFKTDVNANVPGESSQVWPIRIKDRSPLSVQGCYDLEQLRSEIVDGFVVASTLPGNGSGFMGRLLGRMQLRPPAR